jgi:flagellar hook assembly protein FlgD
VDVAKASQVEVSVYDVLGRKIVTLLNGEKAEGAYTMEWNGLDAQGLSVPTGMYLIRMTAGEFNATQKVMLLK